MGRASAAITHPHPSRLLSGCDAFSIRVLPSAARHDAANLPNQISHYRPSPRPSANAVGTGLQATGRVPGERGKAVKAQSVVHHPRQGGRRTRIPRFNTDQLLTGLPSPWRPGEFQPQAWEASVSPCLSPPPRHPLPAQKQARVGHTLSAEETRGDVSLFNAPGALLRGGSGSARLYKRNNQNPGAPPRSSLSIIL